MEGRLEEIVNEVFESDIDLTKYSVLKDFDRSEELKEIKNLIKNIAKNLYIENISFVIDKDYNMIYDFVGDLDKYYTDSLIDIIKEQRYSEPNVRVIYIYILREYLDIVIKQTRKKLRKDWKFQREGMDEVTDMLIETFEEKVNR